MLALLAVVSVVAAGVVVVDRVRRERSQRDADASRVDQLVPQVTPLDSSGFDTWIGYRTRAGTEDITWRMPRTLLIDGPRPSNNIPPPAIVTIWSQGGTELPLRHDAMFMHDLGALGPSDQIIGHRALEEFDGDSPITVEDLPATRDGRAQFDWTEVFDSRVYVGHAWSWDGYLFAVDAAYHEFQPDAPAVQDARNAAYRDLALLVDSVRFAPS